MTRVRAFARAATPEPRSDFAMYLAHVANAAGLYFAKLEAGGSTRTVRIVRSN